MRSGGTFYVWLLGYGPDDSADSFFVQADGGSLVQANLVRKAKSGVICDPKCFISVRRRTSPRFSRTRGRSSRRDGNGSCRSWRALLVMS